MRWFSDRELKHYRRQLMMLGWEWGCTKNVFGKPSFCCPRRQPRGLPGDAIPNEVSRDAVPNKVRREAVPNDPFYVAPSVTFFVAPSVSEGSLGANAPRDDRWEALAPNVELYPSDARSILVRQKVP